MSYDITVEDIEYVRHGGTPLLARLYRPQGTGPFPIMVELHGGAFGGEGQGFIMRKAGSPASNRAIEMIVEFVHKQIR